MKKSTLRKIIEYFMLTFLIAVTGFPMFYSDIEFLIIGSVFSLIIFLNRKIGVDKWFLITISAFAVIEILQSFLFGLFEVKTFLGTLMRLTFAYFTIKTVGKNFFRYFVNIIYFFAIVSLAFYIPSLINQGFANFWVANVAPFFVSPFHSTIDYYQTSPNIIVYTFEKSLFVSSRNSGPFWEPGAFSIFLVLAMMFRLIQHQKFFDKKIVLFIVTILTTTSTSGYLALFLLVIAYFALNERIHVSRYMMVGLLVYGAGLAYMQIEFLGKKAQRDISAASATTSSRFGSALVDLRDFSENPIIGYGRGQNRYGGNTFTVFSAKYHRNNGLTQLLVTYGLVIFILYFYLYYRSFRALCIQYEFNSKFATAMLLIIMLMGFSQGIFTRPFFYGLLFTSTLNIQSRNSRNVQTILQGN